MSAIMKFIIGLIGVGLLAAAAFYSGRDAIRADLTAKATAALEAAGQSWATVSFGDDDETRYRIARLAGIPDSDDGAANALAAVKAVPGIHDALFDGDPTALPAQFSWRADRENNQLVLSGNVPSAEAKAALYKHAVQVFEPVIVIDRMTVANGAPDGDWLGVARLGLDELRKLEPGGYALLSGTELTVLGSTPRVDVKQAVEKTMLALDGGYIGRPTVTLATATPPDGAQVAAPAAADPCEAKVAASIAGRTIGFATAKADLTAEGRVVLDDVAAVLVSCPATQVMIEGHTDVRGDDAMNLALSQARAEAVAAYLGGKGIAPARLTAKGFGETAPLDDADMPSAWAKNRRIAFKVTAAP